MRNPRIKSYRPVMPITRKIAIALAATACILVAKSSYGQVPHCDPKKVITAEGCIKCHTQADAVWKQTPHYRSYETLHRRPEAKAIAQRMGISSIKRSDVCVKCHYTQIEKSNGKLSPVAGVSCESCHGAGKDWVPIHNDYGGPFANKAQESTTHAKMRLNKAIEQGMRNPSNLYLMAKSCLECHTVPNEELVNLGGHSAGSLTFEFVSWSQGTLRHNFMRTNGISNAESSQARKRIMWIAGLMADLEFSTRATGIATTKQTYGMTVAKRAANSALRLYQIQQKIKHPEIETALRAFSKADLKINNTKQLNSIADQIGIAGFNFAAKADGSGMEIVDELIPATNQYK